MDGEQPTGKPTGTRGGSRTSSRDDTRTYKPHTPIYQVRARGLRPHSTPATLIWLEENYEMADGVCIPRNTLYQHYVDFCSWQGLHPVNAASFGKIIRQQFPGLTTRRLGTRGQSRYHYYGIAIREGSKYYEIHYGKRGHSGSDGKKDCLKQVNFFHNRGKSSSLLEFPSLKELHLPQTIPKDKVLTFTMMYRTHCQRVLDSITRASFEEIQSLIHHFWREIPTHLSSILGCYSLINLVGVCDSILYRTVCSVLMPSVLQAIPDRVSQMIRKFSHDYDSWLHHSLTQLPERLRTLKLVFGHRFSRMLRRQLSLNHLCQAARMVLHSSEVTAQMVQDWRQVDLESVAQQTLYTADKQLGCLASLQLIRSLYREFERLLEEGAQLEAFSSWLEGLVDRCVSGASRKSKTPLPKVAHSFLATWTTFGTHLIRDMTLRSLASFGSFHLLHLTFDDFVMCLVENLCCNDRAKELMASISLDILPDISDPCFETEFEREENLPGLSLFFGNSHLEASSISSSNTTSISPSSSSSAPSSSSSAASSSSSLVAPSSTIPQVPLVTSSTTPGVSPNSNLNLPSNTTLDGMDLSLASEDSPMGYISTSASPTNSVLSSSAVISASATPSGVIGIMGSTITEGYVAAEGNNYYCYEYDHRGYKMSTVVGRNYLYSSPTSFNQYYTGGMNTNNFCSGSPGVTTRDDRMENGEGAEAGLHYSTTRPVEMPYLDASGLCYSDQPSLYASNYHGHQTSYETATSYIQKYKR